MSMPRSMSTPSMNSRPSTTCGCGPWPCRGRMASFDGPPNQSRPSGALTIVSFETRVLAASACSWVQLAAAGQGAFADQQRPAAGLSMHGVGQRELRWPTQRAPRSQGHPQGRPRRRTAAELRRPVGGSHRAAGAPRQAATRPIIRLARYGGSSIASGSPTINATRARRSGRRLASDREARAPSPRRAR